MLNFLPMKIMSKKVSKNNVDISTIEIASKKVRGNNVDFSAIEITSKKVRRNNVDFLTIKITSKKYSEMRYFENSSKFGLRCIDIISTSNRCGFDVVCPLGNNKW